MLSQFDKVLEHEARMMNRPVTYRNGWEYVFTEDGLERQFLVVVYDVEPYTVGDVTIATTRYAVFVNGIPNGGGVVS